MSKLSGTLFYIGVDGGGTKTHAVLLNSNLEQIDEIYSGPANIATDIDIAYTSLSTAIDYFISKYHILVENVKIGIGVAGYSANANRKVISGRLQQRYPNIRLNSDCHIACLAAHNNRDGAIIICGTGVVGYSIIKGQTRQIGGWGFPQGDLGGGAYLGLEIARLLCKAIDGIYPWNQTMRDLFTEFFQEDVYTCKMWLINATPADYAKLTKFVFSRPYDELSRHLLEQGAGEILKLIEVTGRDTPDLAIKLVGGLAKLYINLLQQQYPRLELSTSNPAFGGALLWINIS